MPQYALAVDVGGTFTDLVLSDLETGSQAVYKTPSTPDDPSIGFLNGLTKILDASKVEPEDLVHILHGTTIATNSVLENKGAPVSLLVTNGYKYVLEIARHGTPRLANPNTWVKPARPVRPRNCLEINERTTFEGEILRPVDETEIVRAAQDFDKAGVAAIAVAFLHSYANPTNEQRAMEILLRILPDVPVSLSSEVLPVYREYERAITTVLNAYVTPRVSRYIDNLKHSLASLKTPATLSIMKSNGGIIGADAAVSQPVYTALSGPAAGVMATAQIASSVGITSCISFDMGGTSTDVSLLRDGQPGLTLNGKLGDWPIQLPMLDIATIGCGGGSIAKVSPYGSLTVGPDSAGADPGPACYGRGATAATVTDANLLLGRVNTQIAGGQLSLDAPAAAQTVHDTVAEPLGLDLAAASSGIIRIANNAMVGAIRNISVERGHDPRDFALVAYGGAGPMHAIDVANLLGIETVVVPAHPGITSASGLLAAEFKNDYARTVPQKSDNFDARSIAGVFDELEREGMAWLTTEGVPADSRQLTRSADLRYAHQGSELTVQYGNTVVDEPGLRDLVEDFHKEHHQLYGFSLEQPVEIVTLRVTASSHLGTANGFATGRPTHEDPDAAQAIEPETYRQVYFDETAGFVECPIYGRDHLAVGSIVEGPAILEAMDSTVVINPGWLSRIDQHGNCIIRGKGL